MRIFDADVIHYKILSEKESLEKKSAKEVLKIIIDLLEDNSSVLLDVNSLENEIRNSVNRYMGKHKLNKERN